MTATRPMAIVTRPQTIEFEERPLPALGAHDVRLDVKAVTICGSDLHIFKGRHPAAPLPVPVGHEIAGRVVAVGPAVTRVRPGDRVAVEPVLACGSCHFCRRGAYHLCTDISFQYRRGQGGFTPHFVAPEQWLHLLPAGVSYAAGALVEPLSVAVHAVRRSRLAFDQSVAIFGDGAIGLLILLVSHAAGASKRFVVGVNPFNLEHAQTLGATATFDNRSTDAVAAIHRATDGLGVDVSYEAVGIRQTLLQSLHALRKGGTATLVGLFEEAEISLPPNIFVQREISLVGAQGYNWDFQRALSLLESGQVDVTNLITHRFPLERLQDAFDLLLQPERQAIKVLIYLDNEEA